LLPCTCLQYNKLTIDVFHYPGLLRAVSWVLGGEALTQAGNVMHEYQGGTNCVAISLSWAGVDVRIQHAVFNTDEGMAHQVLYITDWKGRKLSHYDAELLQDRLNAFVIFCQPGLKPPEEWASSNVFISNKVSPISQRGFSPAW
jgi:hypothetical protein